jgi:ferredoxin/flavodoxin---NADP+ reductase
MYDLIIIGAGPAGLYAATCAAMNKVNAVLIESSSELGGQLTLYKEKSIYDIPGFSKINTGDFLNQLYKQYLSYKDQVPLHLNTQALEVKGNFGYFIVTTNQGVFEAKTVLLSNGGGMFQPRQLELAQKESMKNIYYFVKDLNELRHKDVVILGGGDSAIDWGLSLLDIAKSVTVIHRRNDFRAHQQNVEHLREFGNVLTPYVPHALVGEDLITHLVIKNLDTNELKTIKTDALLVFYGVSPVKSKIDQWKVDCKDYSILVSPDMKTSREGVYAVGNSIYYEGKLKMIVTALGEAASAVGSITRILYPERTMTYKH